MLSGKESKDKQLIAQHGAVNRTWTLRLFKDGIVTPQFQEIAMQFINGRIPLAFRRIQTTRLEYLRIARIGKKAPHLPRAQAGKLAEKFQSPLFDFAPWRSTRRKS